MLCAECEKREYCSELCPEAELYVKQDTVPQREQPTGFPGFKKLPELKANTHLTRMEKEILTLLGRGLRRSDVCQLLNITPLNLRVHLAHAKKKYLKS